MSTLTVNGRPLDFRMDPQTPLLWALRDGANLVGTKFGCGAGDCGACTVLVDGQAMRACQLSLAEAEGRAVTTIEGLSADGSHPVQRAMAEHQAVQCGFCTSGMVMAAVGLLASNGAPSPDDIAASVTNLCRCGIYPRFVAAVIKAGGMMRPAVNAPAVMRPAVNAPAVNAPVMVKEANP